MIVARRYVVDGRVQGVGFRWFTLEAASREGLSGWVKNRPDGRVEIEAEGEADSVERFERAIRQGPPASRVDAVDTEIHPASGRHTGFTARH